MKKIITLLLFVSCFIIGINNTYAMTEKELEEKLIKSYKVNGENYSISNDIKVLAKRYLDQYEVSSKDADYIAARIDEAVKIIQESGKTNFKDFSKETKEKLKALVEKVSANTSIKATVTRNSIVVYTPNGEKFAEVDKIVKQTGNFDITNFVIISISLFIILAGLFFIKKENKNE